MARLLALALLLSYAGALRAQVIFDGSIGPSSGPAPPGSGFTYEIDPSRGEARGENLFHSFSAFSIGQGQSAGLLGAGFENVVLRVPHAVALFEGTLKSLVAGARVVVLAPQGIVFGDFAQLQVGGALVLSSADQLSFDDGSFHSSAAVPWSAPGCCAGKAVALDFEAGASIAGIEFGSNSAHPIFANGDRPLVAAAGRIDVLESQLSSEGSTIYLAATGLAAATVPLDVDAPPNDWLAALGPEAEIHVSGNSRIFANPGGAQAGRVVLRGGSLVVTDASRVRAGGDYANRPSVEATAAHSLELSDRGKLETSNPGDAGALGIAIHAPRVVIEGGARAQSIGGSALRIEADESLVVSGASVTAYGSGGITVDADEVVLGANGGGASSIETRSLVFGDYNQDAGDITVTARSLALRERAQIRSSSSQSGRNAGNITLAISDLLAISGVGASAEDPGSQSAILQIVEEPELDTTGLPVARSVRVHAGRLELSDAGNIETRGGGHIEIHAESLEAREAASLVTVPSTLSDAGKIDVWASTLNLENGAQIRSTTAGARNAGNIFIDVDGALRIAGVAFDRNGEPIQATISATAGLPDIPESNLGSGGDITLHVDSLEVSAGGFINALSSTRGSAGSIDIVADGLVSIGGSSSGRFSEIRAGTLDGPAGDIQLQAGSLVLNDGAAITASSVGSAPGGSITVTAEENLLLTDAVIGASSRDADSGGSIRLDAAGLISLSRSRVYTDAGRGSGSGGNIAIGLGEEMGPPRLFALQDSDVTATAEKGVGGNIDIRADILLQSADSTFDASSARNVSGSVEVAAPVVQVEGRLDPLPASFLDVRALLLAHCALRHAAGGSSFVIEEGPPPPPSPRGYLASPPRLPASAGSTTSGAPPSVARQLADFDGGCARGGPRERPPRAVDTAGQRPPSRPQLLALSGID